MHQVSVVRNQTHRPLIFAGLVPEILVDTQRELVRSMLGAGVGSVEGGMERRSAIKHTVLQVLGLRVPPPISQCQYGYNQYGGNHHCDASKASIAERRSRRGPESTFAGGCTGDRDNAGRKKQQESEKQRRKRFFHRQSAACKYGNRNCQLSGPLSPSDLDAYFPRT